MRQKLQNCFLDVISISAETNKINFEKKQSLLLPFGGQICKVQDSAYWWYLPTESPIKVHQSLGGLYWHSRLSFQALILVVSFFHSPLGPVGLQAIAGFISWEPFYGCILFLPSITRISNKFSTTKKGKFNKPTVTRMSCCSQ